MLNLGKISKWQKSHQNSPRKFKQNLKIGEGNVLKKISFSQLFEYLKEKLGINALNTKITFVNQVCKGTGAGYIYINPPDTNNDYYLIGATNVDWNACPVSIVAVSRQNSTHIVHFTGTIL